ncbi:MAG TPA: hypothetical protein VJ798_10370 [Rhizomicrobium sp.]|nr:hypothetical protein [Rhizomicrobium sp.]
MTLVPGRSCGDCTVCCTWLAIDKPEIQKESGVTCKHCTAQGCGIYETRYPICRDYYCGWRGMDIFDESWRPDRSGVFPYVETEGIAENFAFSVGIGLMLVDNPLKTVRQRWFQEFVVTGIMNSIPLFLSLPGPRGYQAATCSLNTEEMLEAIKRGTEKEALERAVKLLRNWDFPRAVITHTGNDVGSD